MSVRATGGSELLFDTVKTEFTFPSPLLADEDELSVVIFGLNEKGLATSHSQPLTLPGHALKFRGFFPVGGTETFPPGLVVNNVTSSTVSLSWMPITSSFRVTQVREIVAGYICTT